MDQHSMRKVVEAKNELEGLLYSTEKSFEIIRDKLEKE
jgi:hypothetical protein